MLFLVSASISLVNNKKIQALVKFYVFLIQQIGCIHRIRRKNPSKNPPKSLKGLAFQCFLMEFQSFKVRPQKKERQFRGCKGVFEVLLMFLVVREGRVVERHTVLMVVPLPDQP